MSEIERIADELGRDQRGEPWHGPSARQVLEGIGASAAAAKPIAGGHSIWELVLHIIAWRNEVARRVKGAEPGEPIEGDWPKVGEASDSAWVRALAQLDESQRNLVAALRTLPENRLDEPVAKQTSDSVGSGVSYYVTLHGVAQHDAYHLGQVSILKRAIGAR